MSNGTPESNAQAQNSGPFDFNTFINESKETLLNPKSYFAGLKTTGGMAEPLIKAVIYGAVAGVFAFLWSILRIGSVTGGMFGGAVGVMVFVWYIIAAVIGLFIGAVIILVISAICKGSTDFESNVRVAASLMVVMPIGALLGFASGLNLYLGAVVTLGVNLFSLWLLYNALNETLKASQATVKIVSYVLIALFVISMFVKITALRKASQFMDGFNNSDFKEMMKDLEKEKDNN
ncbi:MAG TPA: Yip1 family protein [Bacteroidales bacterium]|nr:Yip1 family protein [Bacteroidales bacterium]